MAKLRKILNGLSRKAVLKYPQGNHSNNQAKQSYSLYVLLLTLFLVWIICYVSELRIIQNKKKQLIARLDTSNVSSSQLQLALLSTYQVNYIYPIIDVLNKTQNSICLLINHIQGNENWVGSIVSAINQKYQSYKILYMNNQRALTQIFKYMENQGLINKQNLFEGLEKEKINFYKLAQIAQQHCQGYTYIATMEDTWILASENVLSKINDAILKHKQSKQNELQQLFVYGATQVINQQLKQVTVGQSFPYPQNIARQHNFQKYPFVINGINVIDYNLFVNVKCSYCKSKNEQMMQSVVKPAILLQIMNNIKDTQTIYIPEILTIMNWQQQFATPDQIRLKQLAQMIDNIKDSKKQ